MNKSALSFRDFILLMLLLVILIGIGYYLGFYKPLQKELADIAAQSAEIDAQINASMAKVNSMDAMQAELDEIMARPEEEITEIAPYDNKKTVLTEMNAILARTNDRSLQFQNPDIKSDGTVRRNISLSFACDNYEDAKGVIQDLTESRWRCLVSNLSVSGGGSITEGAVSVSATITFFESTKLG